MMFDDISDRKVILACLIGSGGSLKSKNEPVEGSIKLMKEAFLLKNELGDKFKYNFVPYDFGPCSFEICDDLTTLIKDEIVKEEKNGSFSIYSISDSHEEAITQLIEQLDLQVKNAILRIKKEFNKLTYYALIAYVYGKYPSMTKASKFRL